MGAPAAKNELSRYKGGVSMTVLYAEVEGYNGEYIVSSEGNVISAKGKKATEVARNGYERVTLWKNGRGKHFSVHRLVASAFIPNPNNYSMVNHKDGNKLNNHVINLEWCDASQNMKHAYKNNLIDPHTTKVIQYTKDFEKVKEWKSIADASKYLGLNHANIVTVCKQNTNRKFCGGYIWRYADGNI